MPINFSDNAIWLNFAIFASAAVVVWIAGTKLSVYADLISQRTGLKRAFVGLLLLATATSLPEVATTITSGVISNPQLLTANLFGGIAMQTAILPLMDLLLVRRRPLTFFAPEPRLVMDGVMLIGLLALAVIGIAAGGNIEFWGMGPMPILIFVLFVVMLWTTHAPSVQPRWEATNPPQSGHSGRHEADKDGLDREDPGGGALPQHQEEYRDVSNRRIYAGFAIGAAFILVAGYLLARTGDALATQTGVGSTLIGAVLVAIGTSLPEISTTAKAIRLGAHSMAISNIFGSNAFCMALLLVGDIAYRGGPILQNASMSDLFLAGLGVLVTCAYLWGILERRDRTFLGMGVASFVVLVTYLGGLIVLYFVQDGGL